MKHPSTTGHLIKMSTSIRLALALLALLPVLAMQWSASAPTPTASAAGKYALFLPVTAKGTTDNPQPPTSAGLFPTRTPQTVSADVAVDAAGGLHMAYTGYVGYGTLSPGYYAYCDGRPACADPANWQRVEFGSDKDYIIKVELRLTAAGQPRLLLYDESNGRMYWYAACDANCGAPASWTLTNLVEVQSHVDMDSFEYSYHTFALDPQGRPRFIYEDHYGSIHNGLYYVFCDADCANAENWYELNISAGPDYDGDRVQTPDLKFTVQGQPRILTQLYSVDENYPEGVYYITCDADCDTKESWQRTRILDRGNGHASWTMALDANDRPRVAFYQAEMPGGAGNQLQYVWCNADCTTAASWNKAPVGLAQNDGQDPALVLDSQGRPRIAVTKNNLAGIGYLWCDIQCESGAAQWQFRLAEPMSELDADYNIPPPFDCKFSTWSGIRPALALSAAGNPWIGYEGEHIQGGNSCTAKVDYRSVRFISFQKP